MPGHGGWAAAVAEFSVGEGLWPCDLWQVAPGLATSGLRPQKELGFVPAPPALMGKGKI